MNLLTNIIANLVRGIRSLTELQLRVKHNRPSKVAVDRTVVDQFARNLV